MEYFTTNNGYVTTKKQTEKILFIEEWEKGEGGSTLRGFINNQAY